MQALGPQIEDVVEVDAPKQRRDHRALARPLFLHRKTRAAGRYRGWCKATAPYGAGAMLEISYAAASSN